MPSRDEIFNNMEGIVSGDIIESVYNELLHKQTIVLKSDDTDDPDQMV